MTWMLQVCGIKHKAYLHVYSGHAEIELRIPACEMFKFKLIWALGS